MACAADLNRRALPAAGIAESMYYFLGRGSRGWQRRLAGDTARAATTDEVKQLRRKAQDEVSPSRRIELRLLKKHDQGWGEQHGTPRIGWIIRLVEQSHLPARRTLDRRYRSHRRFIAGMIGTDPAGGGARRQAVEAQSGHRTTVPLIFASALL